MLCNTTSCSQNFVYVVLMVYYTVIDKNLFANRSFFSRIDDTLSTDAYLLSGVIQGSVIGPLVSNAYQ